MPQPRSRASFSEPPVRVLRGQQVILDCDLAPFYGVSLGKLHGALKRNETRPPRDFLFRLNAREKRQFRQDCSTEPDFAFTPAGAAWLSAQVGSPEATQMSFAMIRDFDRLRRQMYSYADLPLKLRAVARRCTRRDEDLRYLLSFVEGLIPAQPLQR